MLDPILLWNEVTLEADRVAHTNGAGEQTGPILSSRAMAIVHLAMYDAYAGILKKPAELPRYIEQPVWPDGTDDAKINAAVAGAAHRALTRLYLTQRAFFDAILDAAGDESPDPTSPHQFGVKVADAILMDRENDFRAGGEYRPKRARFKHRVDPDNPAQGFHGPLYGQNFSFAITTRHTLAPPPNSGNTYTNALRQVRGKGIASELAGLLPDSLKKRTPDETLIGIYWAYDGAAELGAPPRRYNQIIRAVSKKRKLSPVQNARLFAFVNVAMGDAGILAWEQKYLHEFWRPVVAIREHDQSFGPAPSEADNDIDNDADPQWLPLGAPNSNRPGTKNFTPPFPAYPSGHATFGAAALHIARLVLEKEKFGTLKDGTLKEDDVLADLGFVSDELNGVTVDNRGTVRPNHNRNFPGGLWKMILENATSRIFLGVHWIFDAFLSEKVSDIVKKTGSQYTGGVPLGLAIAEDIYFARKEGPKKSKIPPLPKPEAMEVEGDVANQYQPSAQSR